MQIFKTEESWFSTNIEPLVMLDQDGHIMQVNHTWIELCVEYELPEVMWTIGADYFASVERFGNADSLRQVLRTWGTEAEGLAYPNFSVKLGDLEWVSVKISPNRQQEGIFNSFILSHSPISIDCVQRITVENVLESMTDGFFLIDSKLNLLYMNEIGKKLLRCNKTVIMGRNLMDSFPEVINTSFYDKYKHALVNQAEVQYEGFYDPLKTWFHVRIHPLQRSGIAVYFRDIGEQKEAEKQLTEFAYFDYLTGLPNRRKLLKDAQEMLEQQQEFTVFFINLDNFKLINTLYGYEAGDQLLKNIAERLKQLKSPECVIGRRDSDNFVIFRRKTDRMELEQFASALHKLLDRAVPLEDYQSITVNTSIGIASFPTDAQTMDQLVAYAELALLEAKKDKRVSYVFFNPEMNTMHDRRLKIEEGLAGNLKNAGFYFVLQPQVNGESGDIVGVEVLSRWRHPEYGELSPLEFIEVAEKTGEIVPLTYHLLTEVFKKMKEWDERYGWTLKTAINVTPSLLSNPTFFEDLIQLMKRYGIKPEWLEIEITEQAELIYSDRALKNLLLCKAKGISVAIDDFGTGFSMIAYLNQFPINKIKIDRHFIRNIGHDAKSEALLKSLIHLAKSIKCELLAEGVEREEEVEFLKNNDCSVFQGYLFDHPMKVEDFEEKYLQ